MARASVLVELLKRVAAGETLTADEAAAAFTSVMAGEASPVQMAALLMGLRVRGEQAREVAGAALALRAAMVRLDVPDPDTLVDTCGTGGGTVTTFNISTAASLVAAGLGVRIAKHGNRSFTSKSGSADVLEALGVPVELPVPHMREVLAEAGIVFMYAPAMHPAMRHVGPVRRELSFQTVMNLVGPLANPASAGRQVMGVADPARQELMAGALAELGTVHSMVVHGAPGLDEVSPLGATTVIELRGHAVTRWTVEPKALGFATMQAADLAGGTPAENAAIVEQVLAGKGNAAATAAVVLNAAAALYVAGKASRYDDAVALARDGVKGGAGMDALRKLRTATQRATD